MFSIVNTIYNYIIPNNINDTKIFALTKYKNYTYKQVLQTNDDKYFKYLISNFKSNYNDIYDFMLYLKQNNKYLNEIDKLLNIKILLDTETTGFTNNDSILQLSYVIFNDYEIIKSYDHVVKINPKIKINNSFIHGITNAICEKDGICINDVLDRFINDLKYCKSIIGHNVNFDIRMLKNEFIRNNKDFIIVDSKVIEDTMILAGGKIKLGVLYEKLFNEKMNNAHNAYYDVLATYKIYKKLKV
jgi:DNA polymerase III epsilon subunit-like protein